MSKLRCLILDHYWVASQGWQNKDDGYWGVTEYTCINCENQRSI